MVESKNERFKRIASSRVNKILDDLRLLGQCSNRYNYYYNKNQVDKIFDVIEQEVVICRKYFEEEKKIL